jgi:hypothetical protein
MAQRLTQVVETAVVAPMIRPLTQAVLKSRRRPHDPPAHAGGSDNYFFSGNLKPMYVPELNPISPNKVGLKSGMLRLL